MSLFGAHSFIPTASIPGTKESVEGGQNVLSDKLVLAFDGAGESPLPVVRSPLDSCTVDEERVAQDVELVVEEAHLVCVGHLVAPPLPGEPLVVERVGVRPQEDGLPVVVRPVALRHPEHPHVG